MYKKDRGFEQHRSFAPIKVGEELDVKIEAVGGKGDGIAKVKGFVIFVPNTKAGEEVRIRINKVSKKVGFGQVIDGSEGSKESSEESSEESSDETEDVQKKHHDEEESLDDSSGESIDETEDSEDFGEDKEEF
mgnify:CR=1 FL=1